MHVKIPRCKFPVRNWLIEAKAVKTIDVKDLVGSWGGERARIARNHNRLGLKIALYSETRRLINVHLPLLG